MGVFFFFFLGAAFPLNAPGPANRKPPGEFFLVFDVAGPGFAWVPLAFPRRRPGPWAQWMVCFKLSFPLTGLMVEWPERRNRSPRAPVSSPRIPSLSALGTPRSIVPWWNPAPLPGSGHPPEQPCFSRSWSFRPTCRLKAC